MPESFPGNEPRPRRSLDDETPLPGQDRYEELYRPAGSSHPRGQHPLLPPRPRHFEPSLQAPEQPDPDDTYGWLFRDSFRQAPAPRTGPDPGDDAFPIWGESGTTIGEPSVEETRVRPPLDPTPSRLTEAVPASPAQRQDPASPSTPVDAAESPAEQTSITVSGVPGLPEVLETREQAGYLTSDVSERARRRWPMYVVGGAIGLVLVSIIVVILVFVFWGDDDAEGATEPVQPAPAESAPPSDDPDASENEEPTPAAGPYEGAVAPIQPAGVSAECVADPAKDAAGNEVHYDGPMATDDDPETAWRCPGDGIGQDLVLTLPEGAVVAELGVVNGYAKTDPADGSDRYPEYRRLTAVTWTFDDGTTVDQQLEDGEQDVQSIRVPPTQASSVTMTIRDSTDPGSNDPSRDAVLVSTVELSAPE